MSKQSLLFFRVALAAGYLYSELSQKFYYKGSLLRTLLRIRNRLAETSKFAERKLVFPARAHSEPAHNCTARQNTGSAQRGDSVGRNAQGTLTYQRLLVLFSEGPPLPLSPYPPLRSAHSEQTSG